MKTRNLSVLQKYEKYGGNYNSLVNYNQKSLKLCNYGRLVTTPTMRSSKYVGSWCHGRKKKADLNVIITGFLHCDMNDHKMRHNVEVNRKNSEEMP